MLLHRGMHSECPQVGLNILMPSGSMKHAHKQCVQCACSLSLASLFAYGCVMPQENEIAEDTRFVGFQQDSMQVQSKIVTGMIKQAGVLTALRSHASC